MKRLIAAILLCLLLAGCAQPTAVAPIEVTREVTRVVVVTATPVPPTPTPVATPTPAFATWTTDQGLQALQAAGLEVVNPREMVKDDFGLTPMAATRAIIFQVPASCPNCNARLMSFDTLDDLTTVQDYYVKLGKASGAFCSWVFVKDNLLLQINGDMPKENAEKYQAALDAIK